MKKILFLMLLAPSICLANGEYPTTPQGLPEAGSGLKIVPMSEMNLSKKTISFLEQQKTKGYSDKESSYPRHLIELGKNNGLGSINDTSDPTDTHMKSDLSKIKLTFKFKQIPFVTPIGFAVGGMYIKDAGWTAIATYFNEKDIGTCGYNLNNMKLSHGAVQMIKEMVRYDINNKPTDIFVEGSINSGFMYNVNWNDSEYNHFLECANMNYDKNIVNKMIELAKKIDRQ